jgi:hypothetical protein
MQHRYVSVERDGMKTYIFKVVVEPGVRLF